MASGNYAGICAGSSSPSFGAFHQPSRLRPFLLASALASGLSILAMDSAAAIYSGVIRSSCSWRVSPAPVC
ncbi:YbfB/YjiJ family MFS transporter [Escherichia coli]